MRAALFILASTCSYVLSAYARQEEIVWELSPDLTAITAFDEANGLVTISLTGITRGWMGIGLSRNW